MIWNDECIKRIDAFAREQGNAFFPYSGQGKDVKDSEGITLEEFNGWLVPLAQEKDFERRWADDEEALFGDDSLEFVWVSWKKVESDFKPIFERIE